MSTEQIRARLAAITPWPWMVVAEGEFIGDHSVRQDDGHDDGWWIAEVCTHINGDDNGKQHAEFIANAPADIASLLSENDALRARVAELEQALDGRASVNEQGEREAEITSDDGGGPYSNIDALRQWADELAPSDPHRSRYGTLFTELSRLRAQLRALTEEREALQVAFDAMKFSCEIQREAKESAESALSAAQEARDRAEARVRELVAGIEDMTEKLRVAVLDNMWRDAESAPRTGEHILVTRLGGQGFGICGGRWQDFAAVVHYWPHEDAGFYLSAGASAPVDDCPIEFTHWRPFESARLVGSASPAVEQTLGPRPEGPRNRVADDMAALAREADDLEQRLIRAKSALENWGHHHPWCASLVPIIEHPADCNCGYLNALNDAAAPESHYHHST